jgi:hypothetical protein
MDCQLKQAAVAAERFDTLDTLDTLDATLAAYGRRVTGARSAHQFGL